MGVGSRPSANALSQMCRSNTEQQERGPAMEKSVSIAVPPVMNTTPRQHPTCNRSASVHIMSMNRCGSTISFGGDAVRITKSEDPRGSSASSVTGSVVDQRDSMGRRTTMTRRWSVNPSKGHRRWSVSRLSTQDLSSIGGLNSEIESNYEDELNRSESKQEQHALDMRAKVEEFKAQQQRLEEEQLAEQERQNLAALETRLEARRQEMALEREKRHEERKQLQEAVRKQRSQQWMEEISKAKKAAEADRRSLLQDLLAKHGFSGVNDRKRTRKITNPILGGYTYPLHVAVENTDCNFLRLLLWAGADKDVRDSGNRTPLSLAWKLDKDGSHGPLMELLVDRQLQ